MRHRGPGTEICLCLTHGVLEERVVETDQDRFDAVWRNLSALHVEPAPRAKLAFAADPTVIDAHSAGLTRATQALDAAMAPSTRYAEYEQTHDDGDTVRLWVGTHLVRAKRGGFVLVVLAFGANDEKREIVAALRLYPTGADEQAAWLETPGLALATLIARYGADYEVERGGRTLFQPSVDFERQRFVMHNRVELPDVTEALGFDYEPDALMAVMMMRLKVGGGVKLYFPMMFRTDSYVADANAAS